LFKGSELKKRVHYQEDISFPKQWKDKKIRFSGSPICRFIENIADFVIHFIICHQYYVPVDSKAKKQVPLDDYVDELLSGIGEVARTGLGGKQFDLMCDMEAPHPSLRASN
jgi:hypothetical protein